MLRADEIEAAIQRPAGSPGRWFTGRANRPRDDRARVASVDVPVRATWRNNDEDEAKIRARRRRDQAAKKYRPATVRLLLIAEAPPSAPDRYFYFEVVATQDSLFRYVARANKAELLGRLRDRGIFLIDLWRDPIDARSNAPDVAGLVRRVRQLAPKRIIVITTGVFDLVREPLLEAGTPLG